MTYFLVVTSSTQVFTGFCFNIQRTVSSLMEIMMFIILNLL